MMKNFIAGLTRLLQKRERMLHHSLVANLLALVTPLVTALLVPKVLLLVPMGCTIPIL